MVRDPLPLRSGRRRTPAGTVLVAAAGIAGCLSFWPVAAQNAQLQERLHRGAVDRLAAGTLLVSARRLPDSNFSRTVVLLADHGREGSMGLVVNRRAEVTVARVFPNLMPTLATAGPAFLGGPVERTQVLALVRGPDVLPGARHVVDGLHLVTARDALESVLAAGATATRVRIYLGYAGWGVRQLEGETAQGAWHVLDGDAAVVFAADPSIMWQQLMARIEAIQAD